MPWILSGPPGPPSVDPPAFGQPYAHLPGQDLTDFVNLQPGLGRVGGRGHDGGSKYIPSQLAVLALVTVIPAAILGSSAF
jgi:hypothetical protein